MMHNSLGARPLAAGDRPFLLNRLSVFYAPGGAESGARDAVTRDGFSGLGAVQVILEFVARQPASVRSSGRWRNAFVLRWAHELSLESRNEDVPFVRRQIQRRLVELLNRYRVPGEAQTSVMQMLDVLGLWSAAQLPLLARGACRDDDDALLFVERALPLLYADQVQTNRMVRIIRAAGRATDEQVLLLMMSGRANVNEIGRLLMNFADAFALARDAAPDLDFFETDTPGHMVLLMMMEEYLAGTPRLKGAYVVARQNAHVMLYPGASIERRLNFLDAFAAGTLFGAPARARLRMNESVVAPPKSPRDPVKYESVDNVLHVDFGCQADFTRGEP